MEHGDYIREKGRGRFRGFELFFSLIVVSFLVYVGFDFYGGQESKSQETIIELHAGVLSRMVSNIHALGNSSKNGVVFINDVGFYLNENGWPANTDVNESPSLYNQKSFECQQIWNSVFSNPPSNDIVENQYKNKIRYMISLNKNVICRYEMLQNGDEPFFIDYDLSNGLVTAGTP